VLVALIQRCLTLREVAAEGVSVAKVQRLELDGLATWTVLGNDHLPIVDVEVFLEHLRVTGRSPNTVKSYARALALWFDFLVLRGCGWADVSLERFGEFLGWLTTGLPPDVAPIAELPRQVSDETVALRLQGVRSFYAFHQRRGLDVAPGLFGRRPFPLPPVPPPRLETRRGAAGDGHGPAAARADANPHAGSGHGDRG
jgi:hypothetical protein